MRSLHSSVIGVLTLTFRQLMSTVIHLAFRKPASMAVPCRSLRLSELAPALCAHIRTHAHTDSPRTLVASRSPRPARSARDREVVPSETKPCRGDTDEAAEEEIKSKVTEIGEARAADIDCGRDRYEDEDECVDRRGSGLVANGDDLLIGGGRHAGLLLVERKKRLVPEVGWRDRGRMRRVRAERSGRKKGYGDREFGC